MNPENTNKMLDMFTTATVPSTRHNTFGVPRACRSVHIGVLARQCLHIYNISLRGHISLGKRLEGSNKAHFSSNEQFVFNKNRSVREGGTQVSPDSSIRGVVGAVYSNATGRRDGSIELGSRLCAYFVSITDTTPITSDRSRVLLPRHVVASLMTDTLE